jgi:hypothetical protein
MVIINNVLHTAKHEHGAYVSPAHVKSYAIPELNSRALPSAKKNRKDILPVAHIPHEFGKPYNRIQLFHL